MQISMCFTSLYLNAVRRFYSICNVGCMGVLHKADVLCGLNLFVYRSFSALSVFQIITRLLKHRQNNISCKSRLKYIRTLILITVKYFSPYPPVLDVVTFSLVHIISVKKLTFFFGGRIVEGILTVYFYQIIWTQIYTNVSYLTTMTIQCQRILWNKTKLKERIFQHTYKCLYVGFSTVNTEMKSMTLIEHKCEKTQSVTLLLFFIPINLVMV